MNKSINLSKVQAFLAKKTKEKLVIIREGYYSHQDSPRMENVYKDRSIKAALELGLKPSKIHPKEHWCWKKR